MVEEEAAYLHPAQTDKGYSSGTCGFLAILGVKNLQIPQCLGAKKKSEKPVYNPIVLL